MQFDLEFWAGVACGLLLALAICIGFAVAALNA